MEGDPDTSLELKDLWQTAWLRAMGGYQACPSWTQLPQGPATSPCLGSTQFCSISQLSAPLTDQESWDQGLLSERAESNKWR